MFWRLFSRCQIARFMGPTWGPSGSCRPQMGSMLAPWTLLSGMLPKTVMMCSLLDDKKMHYVLVFGDPIHVSVRDNVTGLISSFIFLPLASFTMEVNMSLAKCPLKTNGYLANCWLTSLLTHWGRVTHICVGKLTIIGSDNGLSPGRRQAIIWTYAGILLIGPLGT